MIVIEIILAAVTVLLFVVAMLIVLGIVHEAMCKECPYEELCDQHSNDKDFTPPCRKYNHNPMLNQNDFTTW